MGSIGGLEFQNVENISKTPVFRAEAAKAR
jgi:hypothetical protein